MPGILNDGSVIVFSKQFLKRKLDILNKQCKTNINLGFKNVKKKSEKFSRKKKKNAPKINS